MQFAATVIGLLVTCQMCIRLPNFFRFDNDGIFLNTLHLMSAYRMPVGSTTSSRNSKSFHFLCTFCIPARQPDPILSSNTFEILTSILLDRSLVLAPQWLQDSIAVPM